jgi:Ca-activated chloride channel family protein
MQFTEPTYFELFIALPLLGLLFWLAQRQRRRLLARLIQLPILAELSRSVSPARRYLKGILAACAGILLILSLARPKLGQSEQVIEVETADIVFVIDISESMLAEDIKPSRLERAKLELLSALPALAGNRVGIVLFAGSTYTFCPLTTDLDTIRMFLKTLSPDMIGYQGTDIANALSEASDLIRQSQANGGRRPSEAGIILLVSDGEFHTGNIARMTEQLKAANIKISSVAVGRSAGEPIPQRNRRGEISDYKRDKRHQIVLTRLNPEPLQQLSSRGGGGFFSFQDGGDFATFFKQTFAHVRGGKHQVRRVRYEERYQWFLLPALFLLFLEGAISERRSA